jgi:hypothetical protein
MSPAEARQSRLPGPGAPCVGRTAATAPGQPGRGSRHEIWAGLAGPVRARVGRRAGCAAGARPGGWEPENFLWDGTRVRIIDFEYSGRSDRAWELADITEHVSAWVDTEFDVPAFLKHFDLRPAEAARLRDSRRLFALCWLKLLRLQAPPHPRNPPGTVEKQAQRLFELLGC